MKNPTNERLHHRPKLRSTGDSRKVASSSSRPEKPVLRSLGDGKPIGRKLRGADQPTRHEARGRGAE